MREADLSQYSIDQNPECGILPDSREILRMRLQGESRRVNVQRLREGVTMAEGHLDRGVCRLMHNNVLLDLNPVFKARSGRQFRGKGYLGKMPMALGKSAT